MMTRRLTVTKVIYEAGGRWGAEDPMPENLREAIVWLQEKLAALPEDMRDDAALEIEATSYYDNPILEIRITGNRPETDDEMAKRQRLESARAAEAAAASEAEERRAYEALRQKYSDGS